MLGVILGVGAGVEDTEMLGVGLGVGVKLGVELGVLVGVGVTEGQIPN